MRYLPGRDETSQIRVGPFVQVLVAHSVHEELDLSHATSKFGMLGHINNSERLQEELIVVSSKAAVSRSEEQLQYL